MDERRQRLKNSLEALAVAEGVQGAMVVSRDGIGVLHAVNRPLNREMFSAMSAMMMGAAETAVGEIAQSTPNHVLVVTDDLKILVVGATEDTLVVVLGIPAMDTLSLADPIRKVVDDLKQATG